MIPPFDRRRNLAPKLSVSRFLTAACERDEALAEYSQDLFEAYLFWCYVTNTRPINSTLFGREMAKHHFDVIRYGKQGRKARTGIRIKPVFTKREKPICLFPKPVENASTVRPCSRTLNL